MKLAPISKNDFALWSKFRGEIYPLLSRDHDLKEIELIHSSDSWHCWFIETETGKRIGLVELSLRNIVDGCLSSPVPYLEGLYLAEAERGRKIGTEVINLIIQWCRGNGYSELATDAGLSNERAHNFYEKLGFEVVDRVIEYRLDLKKS